MKKKLKRRKDGRYACRYHNQWFYSYDHDDCLKQREDFKRKEREGLVASYFVNEYALRWLERAYPNPNPKTYDSIKRHVLKLNGAIGHLPVSDVRPSDIKQIYSTIYKDVSNEYIKQAKTVFRGIFDAAVSDGLIRSNPARDRTAKPHKGTIGGHRSITEKERQWILTYCHDNRIFPAVMAMLYAGLRPQEAKAVNIDRDVDFSQETITVRQTAHIDPENVYNYVLTDRGKTEKANRRIPLLPPLKSALKGKHGLLIASHDGKPVTKSVWACAWATYKRQMEKEINGCQRRWYGKTKEHKALIAAGKPLPPWVSFDVTPYDLRHSFCTMCRNQVPPIEINTVIKWMGHTDATMILSVYDSVTDERDETEGQRLKQSLTSELTTMP